MGHELTLSDVLRRRTCYTLSRVGNQSILDPKIPELPYVVHPTAQGSGILARRELPFPGHTDLKLYYLCEKEARQTYLSGGQQNHGQGVFRKHDVQGIALNIAFRLGEGTRDKGLNWEILI